MKLVIISDTHNLHDKIDLPKGDILIHCGDATNRGTLTELYKFTSWMKDQNFDQKIAIAGNHDHCFQNENAIKAKDIMKQFGIIYLQDSGIEINGLHIFGQPWQPWFYDWSFNVPRGDEIAKKWTLIPDNTNILITHGPPYGILDLIEDDFSNRDLHQGCEELKKKVDQLTQLKLHAFGHLHSNEQLIKLNKVNFVNAAIVDDNHKVIHKPTIIDL